MEARLEPGIVVDVLSLASRGHVHALSYNSWPIKSSSLFSLLAMIEERGLLADS
jgi:hypothetical protein